MTKSLLANVQPVTVSHCLTINTDLTWSLCVHGKCVHIEDCKALRTLPSVLEIGSANSLLVAVNNLQVCAGHPESHFVTLYESKQDTNRSHDGSITAYKDAHAVILNGDAYPSTVRTSKCELPAKCASCMQYRGLCTVASARPPLRPLKSESKFLATQTTVTSMLKRRMRE